MRLTAPPEADHTPIPNEAGPHPLISDGHRVLAAAAAPGARLYTRADYDGRALEVSPVFWRGGVLAALRAKSNSCVHRRLDAAARRARDHGGRLPGDAEVGAEVLHDRLYFKGGEGHLTWEAARGRLKALADQGRPVRLGLPLFSRKPVSPVKNRGHHPDLADIAALGRCHEVAALLRSVHPAGVEFVVYADGHKYRRACQTPPELVDEYQAGLRYWNRALKQSDLVTVADYEAQLRAVLGDEEMARREALYAENVTLLHAQFGPLVNPTDPAGSLERVGTAEHGHELSFTLRSIVSSVYYRTADLGLRLRRHDEDAEGVYLGFLRSWTPARGRAGGAEFAELAREAWGAAVRYVAISLTDRALGVWRRLNPDGFKLTIHGKPGELHFDPAGREFFGHTPQHTSGGLRRTERGLKITCMYRLERESRGERPVVFADDPAEAEPTVRRMIASRQPVCYLDGRESDPLAALQDGFAHD